MFLCPVCRAPLAFDRQELSCEKGHRFDRAAQGYYNLLPTARKGKRQPGDNPAMTAARTKFLNSGAYEPLSNRLNERITAVPHRAALDAGCGEGYYSGRLLDALGDEISLTGVDISKSSVKAAARRCAGGQFAVASLFSLPLPDQAFDVIFSVFAPTPAGELSRVLRRDGLLLCVYPGPRHLFSLKEVLYDEPYENPVKDHALAGLSAVFRERLRYPFTLTRPELIEGLLGMTPYAYKTPPAGKERLAALHTLTTEADFILMGYRKEG